MMKFVVAITALAISHPSVAADAVYRGDTRKELGEVKDSGVLKVADSTVAMFLAKNLTKRGTAYVVNPTPMSEAMKICEGEKFSEQPSAADCSGILIEDDKVLTAGHCVSNKTCGETFFAFGYAITGIDGWPKELPSDSVYSCKRIVARELSKSLDFAVVEIDRKVREHAPIPLASWKVAEGDDVYLLSHPAGVPLKFSEPDAVLGKSKNSFTAEIDALGGSSGGPVFSARTNELVGILVAGGEDYLKDKKRGCRRVYHCKPGECLGEISLHAATILEHL